MTPLLRPLAFAAPASFTYLVLAPLACGCKGGKNDSTTPVSGLCCSRLFHLSHTRPLACGCKEGKMTPLLRSLAFAAPASFTYLVLAPLACGCKEEK
jgi:hypothetical protein